MSQSTVTLLISSVTALIAAILGGWLGALGSMKAAKQAFELSARLSKESAEDAALYEVYRNARFLKSWLELSKTPLKQNGFEFDPGRLLHGASPYELWLEIVSKQVRLSPTRHVEVAKILQDVMSDSEMDQVLGRVISAIEEILAPHLAVR